jgi:UDP-N-acetyl-D-mannosaminuronic acid transferase (WecB/TagA/CpsF family)
VEFSKVKIFGVGIDDFGPGELIEYSLQTARKSEPATFAYANVHVLNTAYDNPDLACFLNEADAVYCDGSITTFVNIPGRTRNPLCGTRTLARNMRVVESTSG